MRPQPLGLKGSVDSLESYLDQHPWFLESRRAVAISPPLTGLFLAMHSWPRYQAFRSNGCPPSRSPDAEPPAPPVLPPPLPQEQAPRPQLAESQRGFRRPLWDVGRYGLDWASDGSRFDVIKTYP